MTSDPTYSPSPELVEALRARGFYRADVYDTTRAAVAYRTPDGHPELVPWEQVRELVEATEGACGVLYASSNQYARLRAALAPWKDNA